MYSKKWVTTSWTDSILGKSNNCFIRMTHLLLYSPYTTSQHFCVKKLILLTTVIILDVSYEYDAHVWSALSQKLYMLKIFVYNDKAESNLQFTLTTDLFSTCASISELPPSICSMFLTFPSVFPVGEKSMRKKNKVS